MPKILCASQLLGLYKVRGGDVSACAVQIQFHCPCSVLSGLLGLWLSPIIICPSTNFTCVYRALEISCGEFPASKVICNRNDGEDLLNAMQQVPATDRKYNSLVLKWLLFQHNARIHWFTVFLLSFMSSWNAGRNVWLQKRPRKCFSAVVRGTTATRGLLTCRKFQTQKVRLFLRWSTTQACVGSVDLSVWLITSSFSWMGNRRKNVIITVAFWVMKLKAS